MNNIEIIGQLYKNFAEGKIEEVLGTFHPDVICIRPGEPDIPFAGTFKGIDGLIKMFASIEHCIKITSFEINQISGKDDKVIVLGEDAATVLSTGKTYTSDWVYVYTLKEGKITHLRIYLDSLELSRAFKI